MVRCILFLIGDKRERKRKFFIYSLIWTKSIGRSEKLQSHAKIAGNLVVTTELKT